jgi:F-type H+-transporting ATPase subunit a
MASLHISFTPEGVGEIGNIPITNSVITAVLATILILLTVFFVSYKVRSNKISTTKVIAEMFYEGLFGMVESIMGLANATKYFGFVLTFFVFILFSNWLGLMPFVHGVGLVEESHEVSAENHDQEENLACALKGNCYVTTNGVESNLHFTPIFRAPTADLSNTFTLAIISVIVTNLIGLKANGFKFFKRYLDFSSPINFFVGILELISEIGKLISFAFRLFGNVFAGEVLLAVLTSITFGVATMPFLGLELFVGLIQAFVFFMLTSVFIGLASEHH